MAQIGDIVRYLNAVGGGRITRIEGNIAYVDEDGFETPILVKECVVVTPAAPKAKTESKYVAPTTINEQPKLTKIDEVEETASGEMLNIVLAYEPAELKHLNTTSYDAYLVNDSNYYLYFTYLTRSDSGQWSTRYAGIVEPNIQILLGEVSHNDLPDMDRIAVQYIAFKRDKEFALKAPVAVEYRLDTTKFFKLHCFHDNEYFDKPVIAFNIVKNDIPQRSMVIDSSMLEDALKAKRHADRPTRRPVEKKHRRPDVIEVDLHINQLLDSTAGMSPSDMLNVQIDEFRKVMDANINKKGQKIVFIHGKGEGVLRNALSKELNYRYKHCDVQDASFREYGFGATQVTIK